MSGRPQQDLDAKKQAIMKQMQAKRAAMAKKVGAGGAQTAGKPAADPEKMAALKQKIAERRKAAAAGGQKKSTPGPQGKKPSAPPTGKPPLGNPPPKQPPNRPGQPVARQGANPRPMKSAPPQASGAGVKRPAAAASPAARAQAAQKAQQTQVMPRNAQAKAQAAAHAAAAPQRRQPMPPRPAMPQAMPKGPAAGQMVSPMQQHRPGVHVGGVASKLRTQAHDPAFNEMMHLLDNTMERLQGHIDRLEKPFHQRVLETLARMFRTMMTEPNRQQA